MLRILWIKWAMGGVYDHLGGGFYRYSTDDGIWKVPHFEKMLYDNAQLISLYSKGISSIRRPELSSKSSLGDHRIS